MMKKIKQRKICNLGVGKEGGSAETYFNCLKLDKIYNKLYPMNY